MQLKFDTTLDYLVFFIILIKIIFLISAIGHLIFSHAKSDKAAKLDARFVYWKERTEFIFIASMAVLLIYHFHPGLSKKSISEETALLFFLFGWILLFTAKWELFFTESNWYKQLVSSLE
jgi:hypothetical protein